MIKLMPPTIVTGHTVTLSNGNTVFLAKEDDKWYLQFHNKELENLETTVKLSEEAMLALVELYNRIENIEKYSMENLIDSIKNHLEEIKDAEG